jgi:hypothetical protein
LKRIWYAYFIPVSVTERNYMYILNIHAHKNTYTPSFFSAFMIQNLHPFSWQLRSNTETQKGTQM